MMMSRVGRHRCNRRRYHQLQRASREVATGGWKAKRRIGEIWRQACGEQRTSVFGSVSGDSFLAPIVHWQKPLRRGKAKSIGLRPS